MPLSTRIFVSAALVCGAAWLTKTALIAANGGQQTSGGAVGLLWAVGLLGLVTSAGAAAVAWTRGRPTWLRAGAAVAAVPVHHRTVLFLRRNPLATGAAASVLGRALTSSAAEPERRDPEEKRDSRSRRSRHRALRVSRTWP